MYIPYRKAYLTGMNPLSFVTFFTFGELGMMGTLAVSYTGLRSAVASIDGGARCAFLADVGRLHLGDRRCVPAIRREVCGHQPGHPALELESTMGLAVGHFGFWRIAWPQCLACTRK
jgi:hypothetical protein